MSTALKLAIAVALSGSYTGANDTAAPVQNIDLSQRIAFNFGTAAKQADLLFTDTRTLGAGATENLDLNGVLADAFGSAIAAVDVVAVLITADAGNTNDVVVGGAAANAFLLFADPTDKVPVKPGGVFLLAAPGRPAYPVTAATGDLLKIANSAGATPVTYTITVIARSA